MLTTPRIRVGQRAGSFESTYTLGGAEAFRLDAVSWAHSVAADSDNCQPVLRCADADGNVFAECTPPGFSAHNTPNPFGFTYTGPAALADSEAVFMPNGYRGYVFNDFGAVPVTSDTTVTWPQPPGLTADAGVTWFRSPGAVTFGPVIASGTVTDTSTMTVTLAAPAAAGTFIFIAAMVLDTSRLAFNALPGAVTVTDNVGGNALNQQLINSTGVGVQSVRTTTGSWAEGMFLLYQISNPLGVGDRVTITYADQTIAWLSCNLHVVTGLNPVNPATPNPPGQYIGTGGSSATSPLVLHGDVSRGTPIYVGGVLFSGLYVLAPDQIVDVMLAFGGITQTTTATGATLPTRGYTQAAIPELRFGPGDTLTAFAVNSLGQVRGGDVVSDFLIWGVDD